MPVDVPALAALEPYVSRPQNCLPQFANIFREIVRDNGFQMPTTLTEAARLYANIMDEIYG